MCRLFGVMANQEVDVCFSFFGAPKPFKSFSEIHTDGWGIGHYKNSKPKLDKKGLLDVDDPTKYPFKKVKTIKSEIIISHVRKATTGNNSSLNAHPFQYGKWFFAHNGSVNRQSLLRSLGDSYQNTLKGETDSEVYFLLLLQEIEKSNSPIEGIQNALKIVNKAGNYTGLNFLMSDGENLYAYRDAKGNQNDYSLYILKRPQYPINYKSDRTKRLIDIKLSRGERAVLICSEQLTHDEKWEMINLRSLIIVDSNLKIDKKNLLT